MFLTNSTRSTTIKVSAIGYPLEVIQGDTKIKTFTPACSHSCSKWLKTQQSPALFYLIKTEKNLFLQLKHSLQLKEISK